LGNYSAALQALSIVPMAPGYNEQRALTGSPHKADWQETTGRIGLDWQVGENSMIYGFYTRGYKPGGFNPPLNASFVSSGTAAYTFDPEKVDAFEIGTKNTLFDDSLVLNMSTFYYKYKGLQVSMIANNTSINGNMDANIYGFEMESVYVPKFLPNATINLTYGYLNTSVDKTQEVDPLDRGAGNPNLVTLKNIDAGSLTGVSYVADASALTPAFIQTAFASCKALSAANTNTACPAVAAGTDYPAGPFAGIPAYFSQSYLTSQGVFTSDGLKTNIDGNQLPNSPKNTVSAGAAYTFNFSFGTITPRVDFSWMDDSYAREFNTKGDAIQAWHQWNASLLYSSTDGRWEAKGWVRNIQDDDNVTGKYLTSDTSGFYRNYFLTEPRIYGATVKYNFGALQ